MALRLSTRRAQLAVVGALALTLVGCVAPADLEDARGRELRAEDLIEQLESDPASEERDALLAEAREVEATLEARRRELEALTRDAWIQRGIEGGGRAIGGDVPGGAATILGGLMAAALVYLRKKFGDVEKVTDAKLSDMERRRDASREAQEIAPASKGSGVATQSGVAQAARLAKALQAPSGPIQPAPAPQRIPDPLRWSAGAGVPLPPSNPYDVASN